MLIFAFEHRPDIPDRAFVNVDDRYNVVILRTEDGVTAGLYGDQESRLLWLPTIRYSLFSAIFLQLLAVSAQRAYNANMSRFCVNLLFLKDLQRQTSAIAM